MFAAADVYASEEALEKIFPHLRENARVIAFGARLSSAFGKHLEPLLEDALQPLFLNYSKARLRTLAIVSPLALLSPWRGDVDKPP
jgi:hypothetical protein